VQHKRVSAELTGTVDLQRLQDSNFRCCSECWYGCDLAGTEDVAKCRLEFQRLIDLLVQAHSEREFKQRGDGFDFSNESMLVLHRDPLGKDTNGLSLTFAPS